MSFFLNESWESIDTIIPFGYGRVGKRALPKIKELFRIPFLIDNNSKYRQIDGIDIFAMNQALARIQKGRDKIVVLTVGTAYESIKKELEGYGFQENEDFCILERFFGEWYLKYKGLLYLSKVDTVLTSRCTLSCGHCAMFVSHCTNKADAALSELYDNFDLFFQTVDYCLEYTLMGGEPFIYRDLEKAISYLCSRYRDRIGQLVLISNGNARPSDSLLSVLQKGNAMVSISDYTRQAGYKDTLRDFTRHLDEYTIPYYFNVEMEWKDHGYPLNPRHFCDEEMPAHMKACGHSTHSMNNGKLYYCDAMYGAEVNTGYETKSEDVLDFRELRDKFDDVQAKTKVFEYCMGDINGKDYPSFCALCGGIGADNPDVIPAGT